MSTETDFFFLWQLALEVVQAELDELVTVDHGVPSLIASSPSCGMPAFQPFRWPLWAAVSQNITQWQGGTATHVRKPVGGHADEVACR